MTNMLDNILVNPDDGKLFREPIEGFLDSVKKKLQEKDFKCLGIKVTDTPNFIASEATGESFKKEGETFEEHKERAPAWHGTWIPLLEKFTEIFNTESQEIFRKTIVPVYSAGDPTNYLKVLLDIIRPQIEEFIEEDFLSFISRYLLKILSSLQDLMTALLKVIATAGAGYNKLIGVLADIFEDEGEEFVKKFKKSMKDKKDEIVEKFISMFGVELPQMPDFKIPSLSTVLEYFGIVLDPDKPLTNEDIIALVFPGNPNLSIPQGLLIVFIKIIITFIELIIELIQTAGSALFNIGELFKLILQGEFKAAINKLFGGLVNYIMEKLKERVPEMFDAPTFLCSLLAFLEIGVKIFTVVILGHLLGPGLIFQSIAFLVIA